MGISVLGVDDLKVLLLDLDGTLINSEKAFFNSFKDVLMNQYNIVITMEDYKKYELEQNALLIKKLKEQYSFLKDISDKDIMNSVYNNYAAFFRQIILEDEAKDNFQTLEKLKAKGIRLGLVTTCRRIYLDILIKELHLENLFDIIIAREDVEHLKPDSEAYLNALAYFEVSPNECLAIEDSKRGVDAAISAGIKTIKVENFTMIKYKYPGSIECHSANEVLKKILIKK